MKPFPAYKNSGVPWLGEIPKHWEVKRLKYAVEMNTDVLAEETRRDDVLNYVDISNVDSRGKILAPEKMRFQDAPSRARRRVRNGDTILSTVRTYLRAIAFIENPPENLIVSTGFAVLRPGRELHPPFLFRLAQSTPFVENVVAYSEGVGYPAISPSHLACFGIWLPPLTEQRAIAAFLDRETQKLDALVQKKERLIALLTEKRAALITHAVTKGLDPTAPMKDSGVPWLGIVPRHWEVFQLRRVVSKFVDYRGATPEKVAGGIPLVTARNIKNSVIDFELSAEYIREDDYDSWMVRGFPEVGDVLVTTEAPLGESAQIIDPNIALAQRIILLKADKQKITSDYLKYHFASQSGQGELWSRATGSTAVGIKASHFKATLITIPPVLEQLEITRHLDRETGKLDAIVGKVCEQIEKVKEYRSALIAAAVTGKMEVRGGT